MRGRTPLVLFIVIILLVIILAQNGMLSSLSASVMSGNMFGATPLPTGQPLVFFLGEGNQALPLPNLPTAYAPAYPSQTHLQQPIPPGATQTLVPSGVVAATGQCIVPSGWVAYTVQAGETLAVIA